MQKGLLEQVKKHGTIRQRESATRMLEEQEKKDNPPGVKELIKNLKSNKAVQGMTGLALITALGAEGGHLLDLYGGAKRRRSKRRTNRRRNTKRRTSKKRITKKRKTKRRKY